MGLLCEWVLVLLFPKSKSGVQDPSLFFLSAQSMNTSVLPCYWAFRFSLTKYPQIALQKIKNKIPLAVIK